MPTEQTPPSLDGWLVQRGRFVDVVFLVRCGEAEHLVRVRDGQVESVRRGPFVMPSWTFAFTASREAWQRFWASEPTPGFHDLMAMVKFRHLRVDGDLTVLMRNLLYFKALMARLGGAVLEG